VTSCQRTWLKDAACNHLGRCVRLMAVLLGAGLIAGTVLLVVRREDLEPELAG